MTQTERRTSHRLVHYWQSIKGERILPAERDVDADELGDMWDSCFLIYIREGAETEDASFSSYSHVGSHLLPVFVEREGGQDYLITLPPDYLRTAFQEMQMTKLPIVESVKEFRIDSRFIRYRQCLLPLGTEGGEVRGIFGGMSYRYI